MLYLLATNAELVTTVVTLTASLTIIGIILTKEKRNDPERA